MVLPAEIPESVRQDIGIYLDPEEKIVKAISSVSTKSSPGGEIWLILTSNAILFHTRETGKEHVMALIARNQIKEIDYFQKPSEIVLTFVPAQNPNNTTRLSFPANKKEELEDFCDDLADLINFRMETSSGVKVFPKPESSDTKTSKADLRIRKSAAAAKPDHANEAAEKADAAVRQNPPPTSPEVKIVTSSADKKLKEEATSKPGTGAPARYIVVATVVSILVAFLWYQFFRAVSGYGKQ